MISNKYYDNESKKLMDEIIDVEAKLAINSAKTIGDNNKLFDKIEETGELEKILDWRTQKITELPDLTKKNIQVVFKSAPKQSKEINRIIKDTSLTLATQREGALETAADKGLLRKAGDIEDSPAIKSIITTHQLSANSSYNIINNTLISDAGDKYVKILDDVVAKVISGEKTGQVAMKEAVNKWLENGLTGFFGTRKNKDGSVTKIKWSSDAYANMVIRTESNNSAKDCVISRGIEYGNDYIEVSSHGDARELCSQDQGFIYSLSDNTDVIEDLNGEKTVVKAWSITSNGLPAGIFGINCTHQMYHFVPNFSTKTYDHLNESEVAADNMDRNIQRYNERQIRKYKQLSASHKETGSLKEAEKQRQNVLNWQKRQREHIKETGRNRNYDREQVI